MTIVTELAKRLNKSEFEVKNFLLDAPKKYKVYNIPKRKAGHRVIAQPSKELKLYQRELVKVILHVLPQHHAAKAYREGVGIRDNATLHSKQRYLLKMDFENFFNSINKEVFWKVWSNVVRQELIPSDILAIEKLVFWQPNKKNRNKLILSIGAPTSPLISNFCMIEFDNLIDEFCSSIGITYSRYADDITFSTNNRNALFGVPSIVKDYLKVCFGRRIAINNSKTVFSSKAHNRHVTGVTISNDGRLSLGRDRKRYIKHLVHQFSLDKLSENDIQYLSGLLSFANYIEPSFIRSLKDKHPDLNFCNVFRGLK